MCLAKCLKFPEFEAGCAYELYAYKKKRVSMQPEKKIPERLPVNLSVKSCILYQERERDQIVSF